MQDILLQSPLRMVYHPKVLMVPLTAVWLWVLTVLVGCQDFQVKLRAMMFQTVQGRPLQKIVVPVSVVTTAWTCMVACCRSTHFQPLGQAADAVATAQEHLAQEDLGPSVCCPLVIVGLFASLPQVKLLGVPLLPSPLLCLHLKAESESGSHFDAATMQHSVASRQHPSSECVVLSVRRPVGPVEKLQICPMQTLLADDSRLGNQGGPPGWASWRS